MLSRVRRLSKNQMGFLKPFVNGSRCTLYFSTGGPNESEPRSNNKAKDFSGHLHSTADFSKYANSFFAYLRGDQNPSEKTYTTLKVFASRINLKYISASVQAQLYYTLFFSSIGYLVYNYVHVYLTIVPLWFASGSFVGFFMANSYAKKMVHQIELVDATAEFVKLHVAKGKQKEIICKIEDIELLDVFNINTSKKAQMINEPQSQDTEKAHSSNIGKGNFIATFHVEDVNGKKFPNLRMIIDEKVCDIENVELLKYILLGDVEEVKKFKFDDSIKEKIIKEDQEYERQIEDELKRIKKEKEQSEQTGEKKAE